MLSFHGKQEIKDKFLQRLEEHYKADEIVKGVYWEGGKGCAVGCTIHGNDHKKYESELGIPEWLARAEDKIFEGLENNEAKEFPILFLNAIPVGVDLNQIKKEFLIFVLDKHIESVYFDLLPHTNKSIINLFSILKHGKLDSNMCADDHNAAENLASYAYNSAHYVSHFIPPPALVSIACWDDGRKIYSFFKDKLIELLKEAK